LPRRVGGQVKRGWDDEAADLRDAIKGVERHYRQAKAVAKAMAERAIPR
jgi:hypothetical protein